MSPALGLAQAPTPAGSMRFTHPLQITNPYLPLAELKQDILEGTEKGKPIRIERTAMPGSRAFTINGQTVQAMIVEDREYLAGKLSEVTLDYFAQDDGGTVYYLGEDVDDYRNGKVVAHGGAWLYGKQTHTLGVVMPAHPAIGMKFRSEAVGKLSTEDDQVVSLQEHVTVPAGTFTNCLRIREHASDGDSEEKFYAPGVGAIREEAAFLKSHNGAAAKS